MKDKHISIAEDSDLLKQIYSTVHQSMHINRQTTARLLWIKALVYLLLAAAAYFLIYKSTNTIMLVACYITYGLITVLLGFNFAHDFSHNTIFRNKQLNNLCFTFLYTLLGAHAEAWKYRHINSHHYAPNVKDYDSDLQITSLIRVEPDSQYKWFHRYQHLYAPLAYTSYSLYWVTIKDFTIYFSKEDVPYKKKRLFHLSF